MSARKHRTLAVAQKPTKTERRSLAARLAMAIFHKAMTLGYKPWRIGEIVELSDRAYLVRREGWKRLRPGMIVAIGRADYEVGSNGRDLKFLHVRAQR